MTRGNTNNYYEENGYMIGTCSSGVKFYVDKEDYERIKDCCCWSQNNGSIYFYKDGKTYSLARYVLNINDANTKVLHKNMNSFDNRKSNLYAGNVFIDCGDYYEVSDFADKIFYIDKEDLEIVKKYKWHVDCQDYVLAKTEKGRTIKLHRLLLGIVDDLDVEVDHINRKRYDNRKSNLRLADRSTNMCNTGLSAHNKSGYKGVYWSSSANKWCVQISRNKQKYYLGSFDNKEDAINARKRAEEEFNKVI